MAVYTSVNPETLRRAAADVRQLTQPIHIAIRRSIITHPALLDQLRQAAVPGQAQRGPERRKVPKSAPPLSLDPVDAHTQILQELSNWHQKLNLASPGYDQDWQKAVMRQLVGRLPDLAPQVADWAALDIAEWWRLAAVHTGWRPDDLRKIR